MKKILVPIDGTERSMHSLEFIKELYSKDKVEITLMYVKELVFIDGMTIPDEIKNAEKLGNIILKEAEDKIKEYSPKKYLTFGYAGDEIIKKSKQDDIECIVMTKSTKKGLTRMIGSVTAYVVKHSKCIVMIVPE